MWRMSVEAAEEAQYFGAKRERYKEREGGKERERGQASVNCGIFVTYGTESS